MTPRLTLDYGVRYDTTFGLFTASGRSQLDNPALLTLQALQIPLVSGAPHDYRKALAPRLGIVYALGRTARTGHPRRRRPLLQRPRAERLGRRRSRRSTRAPGAVRAARAIRAVFPARRPAAPAPSSIRTTRRRTRCTPAPASSTRSTIAGLLSADWTHEHGAHTLPRVSVQGRLHAQSRRSSRPIRRPQMDNVPDISVFRSDNRSRYDALSVHSRATSPGGFNLTANYTLSRAYTWGCVLGRAVRLCERRLQSAERVCERGLRAVGGGRAATAPCWRARCTRRAASI